MTDLPGSLLMLNEQCELGDRLASAERLRRAHQVRDKASQATLSLVAEGPVSERESMVRSLSKAKSR